MNVWVNLNTSLTFKSTVDTAIDGQINNDVAQQERELEIGVRITT